MGNIKRLEWSFDGVSFTSISDIIYSILFFVDELTYCRIQPLCLLRCTIESKWEIFDD